MQIHPESGVARATLGDAYAMSGQQLSAIESYQEALERNPHNRVVKRKLDGLAGR